MTALHRGANGVIEWAGTPERTSAGLLTPRLVVDGQPVAFKDLVWERLDRWIPRFRIELAEGLSLTGTICAPIGYDASRRGFLYRFELENQGARERAVTVALDGQWAEPVRIIGSARPLAGAHTIAQVAGREGLALEITTPISAALAVAVFGDGAFCDPGSASPGGFSTGRAVRAGPGRRVAVTFYFGLSQEREGALATASALHRIGGERLIKEARLDLSRLLRKKRDIALAALLNRNLLFSYFFSVARALDDDRLYPVTTRSPLHPRCGTVNERDALLWSMPAIAQCDAPLARELLMRCFEQYSHRPGEALRYLDGTVLEPGLALDQWCAYAIAADQYVRSTGDATLLEEPLVRDVLRELDQGIYTRLHSEVFLGATELLPSGEPAPEPYCAYHNALLHGVCRILQRLAPPDSEDARRLGVTAEEISAAVWRRLTVEISGDALLAWSTDLAEAASVYDDPAGSLQLLPFYGFCERTEPIWVNTMQFLRSDAYRLWLGAGAVPGLAARSKPKLAALSAICADLLGNRTDEALRTLKAIALPGGVAASHYEPATGQGTGALHDAALAGLLAWSLEQALVE